MGITEKILLVLFAVFALLAVLRLFAAPLKLAGKLLVNTLLAAKAFDPYPFILLNLVLSCVAAIQAPLIMMRLVFI